MMRSLFSAVSGLKAHQTKFDVIGNNVSNVNTVAFKSQTATFAEVFYQTTQTATGPNAETGKGGTNAQQIGLGSSIGSISTSISTAGASERTDNPWNLMITGNSFFVVNNAGSTYFTRAGDFTVDKQGSLVTSSGANVMGWKTDENGTVIKDKVQPLTVTSPEHNYSAPQRTTGATITGNVKQDGTDSTSFTVDFIDNLGNTYQATMKATYASTASGVKSYTVTGGAVTRNGVATTLTVACSGPLKFNSTTGDAISPDMGSLKLTITDDDGTNNIAAIGIAVDAKSATIDLNASGITNYDSASTIKSERGIKNATTNIYEGAGREAGKMTGAGINDSGCIVAKYSNGDSRVIGQIAVTTFSNPEGLEKVGSNMYSATQNSGDFDGIGQDVTADGGKISSGVLEMSNVDLANEFTSMITTQRGYQANSRVITVSDTLLEELINLKR